MSVDSSSARIVTKPLLSSPGVDLFPCDFLTVSQRGFSKNIDTVKSSSPLIPIYITHNQQVVLNTDKKVARCILISIGMLALLFLLYIPVYHQVQSGLESVQGWSYNSSRDMSSYVLPNRFTTLHQPSNICMSHGTEPKVDLFLLIVVCSAVENFRARSAIRETWGNLTDFNYTSFVNKQYHKYVHLNQSNDIFLQNVDNTDKYVESLYSSKPPTQIGALAISSPYSLHYDKLDIDKSYVKVKVVFLVGLPNSVNETDIQYEIDRESQFYDDVIQERFIDSYNNLTLKSVMLLKWVNKHCNNSVQYVMKTDDDVFVHVYNLVHVLKGSHNNNKRFQKYNAQENDLKNTQSHKSDRYSLGRNNLLLGSLICGAQPISDTKSKWYSPKYMYSGRVYPHYLSGTGYVMSIDTAKQLYRAALVTPIFHLEDVYITGICSLKSKIKPQNSPLFTYQKKPLSYCDYSHTVTSHQLSPSELKIVSKILESPDESEEICAQKALIEERMRKKKPVRNPNKKKTGCH